MIEKGLGYKGKGNYRITDAFTVERTFYENLTFKFKFDDLKDTNNDRMFTIKAEVIDIPLQCDCIIGLTQIKKDKIFKILPGLVEESLETNEEWDIDWKDVKERDDYPTMKLSMIESKVWYGKNAQPAPLIEDYDSDCESENTDTTTETKDTEMEEESLK